MKKPNTHVTDTKAKAVLQTILAKWSINEQHSDYGKDFLVEIVDDQENLTGISFLVQLKGTENPTVTKGRIAFPLERKHIDYYTKKVKDLPVFLIVVDVTNTKTWYLFLQRYLINADIRNRKKTTIHIPISNEICDLASFRTAIEEANKYMRVKAPNIIKDYFDTLSNEITSKDRRFSIAAMNHDGITENISLRVSEPVSLDLVFNTTKESTRRKLDDLFGRGANVSLEPGELIIKGSDLFDFFEKSGGSIQFRSKLESLVDIFIYDNKDNILAESRGVQAVAQGGFNEFSLDFIFGNSPLTITTRPIAASKTGKLQVDLDFAKWENLPILDLPWFDPILKLSKAIHEGNRAELVVMRDGITVNKLHFEIPKIKELAEIRRFLENILIAREIFRKVSLNPLWFVKPFFKSLDDLPIVKSLLETGYYRCKKPNCEIRNTLVKNINPVSLIGKPPAKLEFHSGSELECFILGEAIKFPGIDHEFTSVRVTDEKWNEDKTTKEITYKATQDNEMILRVVK